MRMRKPPFVSLKRIKKAISMGTTMFICGCCITRSMFGDNQLLHVMPCIKHALQSQDELKALSDKVMDLIKNESDVDPDYNA